MAHQIAEPVRTQSAVAAATESHRRETLPRLERLWAYYRNALDPVGHGGAPRAGRWYRLAQEAGLPARIVSREGGYAREIVIENDIAWRVHAMVDFLLGKPVRLVSTARDEQARATIERVLDRVWEASGGIALLQDAALLGHVFGHVDFVVRSGGAPGAGAIEDRAAASARVEVVEPRRGVPVLNPADYRRLDAYAIRVERDDAEPGLLASLLPRLAGGEFRRRSETLEVFAPGERRVYHDGRLADEERGAWWGDELPVVHVQNGSQPFRYEGLGEVEPLIPLQDELNTRLSDRANRVTMQSFKMYLAKGLDGFDAMPVRPGVVWSTDNPDAEVQAFGGDASSPSEEAHIREIRDALDKASGVPPIASGVVQAKIGNLSSANALRVTLMGVLSKTARKQVTYGAGIARASRLVLAALDASGVLRTDEADRGVRVVWPDPLPIDPHDTALAAKAKADLGVPRERVLAELGYAPGDDGVSGEIAANAAERRMAMDGANEGVTVESLQAKVDELSATLAQTREALDGAERRHAIDLELIRGEAIDLETARLLTQASVTQMKDADASAVVADLRRRKPFLFRRPGGRAGEGAMAPHAGGSGAADSAREAAATGDRAALLRYLRARRVGS